MELRHSQTIQVPQAAAFAAMTDFARFEQDGFMGLTFERLSEGDSGLIGTEWRVTVASFRGRKRRFRLKLHELVAPGLIRYQSRSEKFELVITYALAEQGTDACRLDFSIEAAARSLTGRLIFQTLQLARGRLERDLATEIGKLAAQVEADYAP